MKKQNTFVFKLLIFGVILWVLVYLFDVGRVRDWGVDVEGPLRWLPVNSSNITYVETGISRLAEFDISLIDFKSWAEDIGKPVEMIETGKSETFARANVYLAMNYLIEQHPFANLDVEGVEEEELFLSYIEWSRVTLEEEDYIYKRIFGGGGGYWLGYDVSESRAYYAYNNR